MENFSRFGILYSLANFSWAFVASNKGINLLKDIKNYKDKAYNTLTTYSLHVPEIQKRVQSA